MFSDTLKLLKNSIPGLPSIDRWHGVFSKQPLKISSIAAGQMSSWLSKNVVCFSFNEWDNLWKHIIKIVDM